MIGKVGHIKKYGDRHYYSQSFGSIVEFDDFVTQQFSLLSPHNKKVWRETYKGAQEEVAGGSGWYGHPPPQTIKDLEDHSSFLGMSLIGEVRDRMNRHFAKYLRHLEENVMPKPQMAYNSRGLGVFSFDRAAMGLYPAPRVNMSSPLEAITSQLKVELNKDDVLTRTQEVFCHFENRNNSYPSIRLFVGNGANAWVNGDSLLYIGLACAELVRFLEDRGVPVEVNVLHGTLLDRKVLLGVIRVKRFDETLDKNQLLLLSSDPRWYRFHGFKALIALADSFKIDISWGLGSDEEDMYRRYVESTDQNGFVFEQSYSLESCTQEVIRIIEEYQNMIKTLRELNLNF